MKLSFNSFYFWNVGMCSLNVEMCQHL